MPRRKKWHRRRRSDTTLPEGGRVPVTPAVPRLPHEREERRFEDIWAGRVTAEYLEYTTAVAVPDRTLEDPVIPDHRDSEISRRQWKRAVHKWRQELQRFRPHQDSR